MIDGCNCYPCKRERDNDGDKMNKSETTDEGFVNEVGAYLTKDLAKTFSFPIKVIYNFGKWLAVPKHTANLLEVLSVIALYFWILFSCAIPTFLTVSSRSISFLFAMSFAMFGTIMVIGFTVWRTTDD